MGALSLFMYCPLRRRVLALAAQPGRLTQQWVMLGDVVRMNDEPAIGKIKKIYHNIYKKLPGVVHTHAFHSVRVSMQMLLF